MTWLDVVVIVVWVVVTFWGLKTGLVSMLFPLAIVVGSLLLGGVLAGPIGDLFSLLTDDETVQTIGGYALIFVVLFVAGSLAMHFLSVSSRFVPSSGLANNAAGGVVGFMVGFVLLSGILAGLQKLPSDYAQQRVNESQLGSHMAENFGLVVRFIPGDWNRMYGEARDSVEGVLE